MGDTIQAARAMQYLKPLIDRMLGGCTKETANQLKETLSTIDKHALQKLQTFILVPILGEIADPKLNKEVKIILLDCVHVILVPIHLNSVNGVKNILRMIMMEIFDHKSPNMIKDVPEEMKLSVMNCALPVLTNMPHDVQDKFYTKENIPEICQIAYTCLELAISEKLRALRVRAMEVLLALQQIPLEGLDRRSPWERQTVADIFQFILPGACSKLMFIISGDITQGSKVLSTAIFTLSAMIALVMEDYASVDNTDIKTMMAALVQMSEVKESDNTNFVPEQISRSAAGAKKLIESSKGRTLEWRKQISSNLLPYLSKIAAQCEHSDSKVCKVVAQSCFLILSRSPVSLKDGLAPLLDAVVRLSVHEDYEVREESLILIKQLNEYFTEHNGYDFIQLAEENFYMLLTRLPRTVQEEGGARGASAVALLSGYVQLLRPSMRNVLSSSAHLQRLTLSLLHVVTIEPSNVNVSNEHSMRELISERCDDLNVPWMTLRFSSDKATLYNVQQLCDIVAEKSVGVFDVLGSQLVDTFLAVPYFRKESILFLNIFMLSACRVKNDFASEFASSLLDVYLLPDVWPPRQNSNCVTTVARAQQDIITVCLLTEGIGCCIYALGKEKAQSHLLRVLYPLLEQAGSPNSCVAPAGRRALTRVAAACGFSSDLLALISNNMDYLSHCMSVRLRRPDEQMGVFNALSLILRHSSPEIALGLYKIVVNVLHQSSDVTQRKNNEAHLRVFLTFAQGVCQWLQPSSNDENLDHLKADLHNAKPCENNNFTSLSLNQGSNQVKWTAAEKLREYVKTLKPDSFEETEEENLRDPTQELPRDKQPHVLAEENKDDVMMEDSSDKKEDIPELAKLLVLVLKRCLHFLPTQVEDHQFLAIRTLDAGFQALEPFTDTLLPIVHLAWSPLVGRFAVGQPPLIIRTAFQLLQTMARTAKDFLMSRTVKEAIPQFEKFLKSSSGDSYLKDRASVYRFSQKYKTQLSLLSGLGPLVYHLQLKGQDFYGLLSVSLPYLSCNQPHPLQAAAVSLIEHLYSLDADAVWWGLVAWWTPPHLALSLKLSQPPLHQDCEGNVRHLLGLSSKTIEDNGQGEN